MHGRTFTKRGTAVIDLDAEGYREYLDGEAQASVGMNAEAFRELVRRGDVDWDDPDAVYLAGLLGVNGAKP